MIDGQWPLTNQMYSYWWARFDRVMKVAGLGRRISSLFFPDLQPPPWKRINQPYSGAWVDRSEHIYCLLLGPVFHVQWGGSHVISLLFGGISEVCDRSTQPAWFGIHFPKLPSLKPRLENPPSFVSSLRERRATCNKTSRTFRTRGVIKDEANTQIRPIFDFQCIENGWPLDDQLQGDCIARGEHSSNTREDSQSNAFDFHYSHAISNIGPYHRFQLRFLNTKIKVGSPRHGDVKLLFLEEPDLPDDLECPLLEISHKELAKQLTLLEWEYWQSIEAKELVTQGWTATDKEKISPNGNWTSIAYFPLFIHWKFSAWFAGSTLSLLKSNW